MASKGSKSLAFGDNSLKWSWEIQSLNPADSEATIAWKAEISAGEFDVAYDGYTMDIMDYDKVQGTTETGSAFGTVSAKATSQIASGTFVIGHTNSAYGRTNITFKIVAAGQGLTLYCGFTLDAPMHGGTLLSAQNFSDEENPVIEYALDYLSGVSLTGQIKIGYLTITRDLPIVYQGSYTFRLTDKERNDIRSIVKDSPSATAQFTLVTYSGGTNIEHSLDKTVTIINAAPVLAPTWKSNSEFDYILNAHNSIDVACNSTAQKGATIVNEYISCGSKKIAAGSGTLTDITVSTIAFTAVDSRGYTSTQYINIELVPYVKLTCNIESTEPIRVDSEHIKVTFDISGAFYNGGFNDGGSPNAVTVYYRTKLDDTYGEWTWVESSISGDAYYATVELEVDYGQQVTIEAEVQDAIDRVTATTISKKVLPTFDWSPEDFNFNVPIYVKGCEVPYIVESGNFYKNGDFYWRKWSDGTAELWGHASFETAFNNQWGNLYTSGAISASNITFPTGLFTETPSIIAQLRVRSTGAFLMVPGGTSVASKSNTGAYELVRPAAYSTISAFTICYNVKGRWK